MMDKNIKYIFALLAVVFMLSQVVPVESLGINLNGITGGVIASRDCTTRNLKMEQAVKVHGNNVKLNGVQATGFSEYDVNVEINDKPYTITKKFGLLGILEKDEDVSVQVSAATDSVSNLHDTATLSICAKPRF